MGCRWGMALRLPRATARARTYHPTIPQSAFIIYIKINSYSFSLCPTSTSPMRDAANATMTSRTDTMQTM